MTGAWSELGWSRRTVGSVVTEGSGASRTASPEAPTDPRLLKQTP
jgi:hypothetical protein